jgi:hypothetical protein
VGFKKVGSGKRRVESGEWEKLSVFRQLAQ